MAIVVKEKTGSKFRPSNWAERLAGNLATFENHRLNYSPLAYPTTIDGQHVIIIDDSLKEKNPDAYVMLMLFVSDNDLIIEEIFT